MVINNNSPCHCPCHCPCHSGLVYEQKIAISLYTERKYLRCLDYFSLRIVLIGTGKTSGPGCSKAG